MVAISPILKPDLRFCLPLYEKLVADLGFATGLGPEEAVDVLWLLIQYSHLTIPGIRLLVKD